jgi:hypothetical protein
MRSLGSMMSLSSPPSWTAMKTCQGPHEGRADQAAGVGRRTAHDFADASWMNVRRITDSNAG